jgi:FtsZ-interacting cell division protein ZipA
MSNWNKIKEHGGLIAILALIIGGFWHMDNKFDRLNDKMDASLDRMSDKMERVLVRLERHDVHIDYLMSGRVQIQAPSNVDN